MTTLARFRDCISDLVAHLGGPFHGSRSRVRSLARNLLRDDHPLLLALVEVHAVGLFRSPLSPGSGLPREDGGCSDFPGGSVSRRAKEAELTRLVNPASYGRGL